MCPFASTRDGNVFMVTVPAPVDVDGRPDFTPLLKDHRTRCDYPSSAGLEKERPHHNPYLRTVVRNPKDELKTGIYQAMLKQLELTEHDLF
jgi:hypothetical protein